MQNNAPSKILYSPPSWFERLDWSAMFSKSQPIEVDLGCGDGSLLLHWAKRFPERNWLGVERLKGRVLKLERKAPRLGIAGNLRALRIESGYAVEWLFPPASIAACHIYFPDPWPKKRHHKHRLIQPPFVAALARTLEPGGSAHLATDHADYFAEMLLCFNANANFERVEPVVPATPEEMTDFERDFVTEGRPISRARFRKVKSKE
ncbi:MAG: tRNA (guanosine(46)-N7)-methyltransferase TrmB [Verrucomicrobia bacterium]|nr:tRNA (guanosine(46)-N7)-methyltransferase TrmB [Verrucomicrobiota bacterium]